MSESSETRERVTKPQKKKLGRGEIVETSHASYEVILLLGEGGFGAVYRVKNKSTGEQFAMKVEYSSIKKSKLKMEIAILKSLDFKCKHFTRIEGRGRGKNFQFVIMTLVGPSLEDMRRERPKKVFSLGTAFGAGIQCLEAIQELHQQKYLHRDIKPANFARGLEIFRRIVYLLDFGIARKFTNEEGELKTPRKKVYFKGTVRFAAINCHKEIELGPKDDVESWIYLLLDILVPGGLPWRGLETKDEVLQSKKASRKPDVRNKAMFGNMKCDIILGKVIDYVDGLAYSDHVDYAYIVDLCKLACSACQGNTEDLYDWEKAD
ncbi:unnamed protein product [Bursaphelenchus okinawaensis]|uniref:Protein kinase domain-containing protein n=1 Tax=Bursaphelenchus okinawaensis TaxID=465554 RepID=A0A811KDH2_9BILA|nr:unnamed protein product [Bursaphelenchus okinawaensis]CAG9098232.1 unnamed protein product [Bursaphelenchus okinawaensis]